MSTIAFLLTNYSNLAFFIIFHSPIYYEFYASLFRVSPGPNLYCESILIILFLKNSFEIKKYMQYY